MLFITPKMTRHDFSLFSINSMQNIHALFACRMRFWSLGKHDVCFRRVLVFPES